MLIVAVYDPFPPPSRLHCFKQVTRNWKIGCNMADWDVWNWTRTHLEWNQRKTHVSSTSTGTTTYQKYYQTQSNGNWSYMCLVSVTPPLRTCATIGQPLKSIQARIGVFLVPPTRSNPIQANPSSAVNDLKEAKEWGILSRFSRDNFRTLLVIFLTIIIAGYHQPAAAAVIQLEYKKNRTEKKMLLLASSSSSCFSLETFISLSTGFHPHSLTLERRFKGRRSVASGCLVEQVTARTESTWRVDLASHPARFPLNVDFRLSLTRVVMALVDF